MFNCILANDVSCYQKIVLLLFSVSLADVYASVS